MSILKFDRQKTIQSFAKLFKSSIFFHILYIQHYLANINVSGQNNGAFK